MRNSILCLEAALMSMPQSDLREEAQVELHHIRAELRQRTDQARDGYHFICDSALRNQAPYDTPEEKWLCRHDGQPCKPECRRRKTSEETPDEQVRLVAEHVRFKA